METPDSLAVDSSYWQQLADIIATADCLQYVHRVRLVKISERMTGLIADIHLNPAVVSADRFLPESELYYVAHNTTYSSCVSICKQGAFRPSKWNQDDITWLPPLTFYARGHLTHEPVALRKAAEYKSESRPFCVLARAKTRQVDHPHGSYYCLLSRHSEIQRWPLGVPLQCCRAHRHCNLGVSVSGVHSSSYYPSHLNVSSCELFFFFFHIVPFLLWQISRYTSCITVTVSFLRFCSDFKQSM